MDKHWVHRIIDLHNIANKLQCGLGFELYLRFGLGHMRIGHVLIRVQGVKPLEVFNRLYTVFGGNFVNIWDANGFSPSQGSFRFLSRVYIDSRLGGCEIYVSEIYFSFFLKNKKKKTEVTLSLILRFNLRLGGLLHMEHEHLTASRKMEVLEGLLDVSEGRTRSNQKDVLTTWSTRWRQAKYSTPGGLSYEELGGLSDPGQRDCL